MSERIFAKFAHLDRALKYNCYRYTWYLVHEYRVAAVAGAAKRIFPTTMGHAFARLLHSSNSLSLVSI